LLACGIAGCYVAQEKNRGDIEDWIFGFLFGPLGVLIEACLPTLPPKTEPTQQPAQSAEGPTRTVQPRRLLGEVKDE
jgi:hypothetical protein